MILELDGLTHRYGDERAVEDVSFGLHSGEVVALVGPSGCGKTTIVQSIAGHVAPTAGRISLRGADVTTDPPESRDVGLVFQRSTLYPHMTVGGNVAYGLAAHDIEPDRRGEIVSEYLELVSLGSQREAYPSELSGGQKRRVELARALAPEPDVLLLDEPLSALDRALRERLREEIARIQRETGVTTLYVTHDQTEAMALADRLVVMADGRISGRGEPRTLYESPPTPFIASFLGRSNTLSATVVDTEPLTVSVGTAQLTLRETKREWPAGTTVTCHVRPKDLSLWIDGSNGSMAAVPGTVTRAADLGRRYDVIVRTESGEEVLVERTDPPPAVGDSVGVVFPEHNVTLFEDEDHGGGEVATDRLAGSGRSTTLTD